jgi:hypothetical protein
MAAGRALWRSTDFLVLSRVCVRAIRPVRISNRSVTSCGLSMPVSLVYFPDSPGRFWVDLLARAGWKKRERTNFMGRITILFLRRWWLPTIVFGAFCLICVAVYTTLEGLRAIDVFFWIFHPHSIDYRSVRAATKLFSIFVYVGVFAFQVWIAERVLVTIFNRQGLEAWKSMINDANIAKLKDHFIICGYGQVGRGRPTHPPGDSVCAHLDQRRTLPRTPE